MLSPGGLLLRLFGISCPPLDGLCWDSPESSLSQRLQPPQTRGGNLAALSLRRIPAGRNSWNCWWCLFSRGRQGSFVLVSSALPVSVADTSRVPCTTPVLLAAAVAELKAGGAAPRTRCSKKISKDLGFQNKMLPLPPLQHSHYNSTVSVSQNLAILMTKYCDATKYF